MSLDRIGTRKAAVFPDPVYNVIEDHSTVLVE